MRDIDMIKNTECLPVNSFIMIVSNAYNREKLLLFEDEKLVKIFIINTMLNLAHTGYLNQAGICMSQPPSRGPGFTQRLKPPSIFEKKKSQSAVGLSPR